MSVVTIVAILVLALVDLRLLFLFAGRLGWRATFAWLLGAAILGLLLLRASRAGLTSTLRAGDLDRRAADALGRAAALSIAGVLLLLPGLLSDAAALVLLVPSVRRRILRRIFRIASLDPFESMGYGEGLGPRPGGVDPVAGKQEASFRGKVRDVEFEVVDTPPSVPPASGGGDERSTQDH